ncbi:5-formyltetrahydrofolate cyclo-ligase [Novosphingobium album (ex Hu et al. 2023)]|uniref:5-formyltetrahydrofolate cyclo-ligase n=1 Tax=Novosphingobium album (ex Hu et al. 2023) TaxID=2930093 RepID=A0ABT0AX85_9SPHN|nr:5-formyltetrahydrofolate cyclo-ligase [Novosphingobium album (ex Hu et al. 2023)]MCJ2177387.1 5-formyltetrahydrofolate cyclo-ligase [Novosphingobium album (ex Hu et al. 2023)]
MVDPSPPISLADEKAALRKAHRKARADHVAGLPQGLRALVLKRPPAPIVAMIPEGAAVGLYHPTGAEAPAIGWARWLAENGRQVALPWFAGRDAVMEFRAWNNPWDDDLLTAGPWGALQPKEGDGLVIPDIVVVPLLAFTASGHRLGQGGGHYDRWLAAHPGVSAIGLAWDCQIAEELPFEPHDHPLAAVVTPTRIYEGQQ